MNQQASGGRSASDVEMNRVSLPPGPLSKSPIYSFQDLQEALLNQQNLPGCVLAYFAASDQLKDVTRELQGILKDELEDRTSTSCSRENLAASTATLEEVVSKVKAAVSQNESPMQIKESDDIILDAELRRINHLKIISRAIFTLFAGFFSGVGISFAFKIHGVAVGVFAAVATVACLAMGYWIDSHQDELKIRVDKRKEMTNAVLEASVYVLEDLRGIKILAKSMTESILRMVESGATASNVVVTKMEELKEEFEQLKIKVEDCSKKATSKRQALLLIVHSKLDYIEFDRS